MPKPALGRGLGALLGGSPIAKPPGPAPATTAAQLTPLPGPGERVEFVSLDRVLPCPFQPRKAFSEEALQELADSIKQNGIVQPLIVRTRNDHFELIAGERRWRAAQKAGLAQVPVIVRQADDRTVLELALIENLQRENLNPIEEAQGYSQLIGQFSQTQEEVAAKVGKSRSLVANSLRLLKLGPEIQNYIQEGRLSVGHAKVILALADERQQRSAADRILKEGLNVRQTEVLVARYQAKGSGSGRNDATSATSRDPHVMNLENKLRERLGTRVHLQYNHGKGAMDIRFFSDAELERILQILGVTSD